MGTFAGHILPGVFFGFFGLWWSFITSLRFIQSKVKHPNKKNENIGYHSSVTMPCVCLPCSRLPIESFIKIFFCTIGVIGELVTGFHTRDVPKHKVYTTRSHESHEHMHKRDLTSNMNNSTSSSPAFASTVTTPEMVTEIWFLPGNGQHISIYTPFIIGGLIEVLRYKKYAIPAKLEWALGSFAFLIEAYIFGYHLHGKDPLDVHLHILLVYSILGCFMFSCLETFKPREILFTYGRILCTILQATWFVEIAFVVFTPDDRPDLKWDYHDMNQMMIITMSFVWHIFAIIAFLLIQMWSMKFFYYFLKKVAPQIDENLWSEECEISSNNDVNAAQMNKFRFEIESENEKFDSLKLKVKNENSSSGNSSGRSSGNKSPV